MTRPLTQRQQKPPLKILLLKRRLKAVDLAQAHRQLSRVRQQHKCPRPSLQIRLRWDQAAVVAPAEMVARRRTLSRTAEAFGSRRLSSFLGLQAGADAKCCDGECSRLAFADVA